MRGCDYKAEAAAVAAIALFCSEIGVMDRLKSFLYFPTSSICVCPRRGRVNEPGENFFWDTCVYQKAGKFLCCQGGVRMIGWGHGRIATNDDATTAADPGGRERCTTGANSTARAGHHAAARTGCPAAATGYGL